MVDEDDQHCPICGGRLFHYDYVRRVIKTKHGLKQVIKMERKYCKEHRHVHRVISADVMPYKQYEKEMILGVQEGFITPDTYGFEDFPSEKQMDRWKREENSSSNE